MIKHLYKNFLNSIEEYRASEDFWRDRWQREGFPADQRLGWSYPWISTGSPDFLDGNPIFSAFSPSQRRGVRIIQHEPTSRKLEIQAWPDFVGGRYYDPDAIQELVISCALSEAAADWALALVRPWVAGRPISFDKKTSGLVATNRDLAGQSFNDILLPSA
jgi:hypothetical protein